MDAHTRLERTSLVVPADRGELRLEGAHLTIRKQRAAQAEPTTITIPTEAIRGATLERPARGQPGWLHVAVVGGTPVPATDLGSTLDPYTLPVTSRNVAAARRLVRLVTQHVQERGLPTEPTAETGRVSSSVTVTTAPRAAPAPPPSSTPPPPIPPPGAEPAPSDPAALTRTLRELAALNEAGALSDEEFRRAKARVLDAR
jgi:hypothetical protein